MQERQAGESKYSLYKLVRLNFDLVTGFSVVPLQMFSLLGFAVSLMGLVFFGIIAYRRIFLGPEAEGLFTLFAINFLLLGVALFGIGLLGEYVGRIYQQVRERPRYLVQAILEQRDESAPMSEEHGRTLHTAAPAPAAARAFALMRAVVFAYHNVGCRCLSVLLAHGLEVALVVTHDDNPDETIWFDSVERLAGLHDLPVAKPVDPNAEDFVERVRRAAPDFLFSFYYRQMLGRALLEIPPRGALNMHGSLLPRYRGRVPVNWAVLHGERETGATLHYMVDKPDAGDVVAQQAVPILPEDTAVEVFNKVCRRRRAGARSRAAGSAGGNRTQAAAGSVPRVLLRRPPSRRRPHRLEPAGGRDPQPGARPCPALPGRLHAGRRTHGALSARPPATWPARSLRPPGPVLRSWPLLSRMR